MSAKLTLKIDQSVIEQAKKYARSQGRSLSSIVEEYLKSVTERDIEFEEAKLSPITRSLYGSVKLKTEDVDYKKIIGDEIFKKHL